MGEENKEQTEQRTDREEFEAIPADRTFAQIKLYLNDDNLIAGGVYYDGEMLLALGVSDELAMECSAVTKYAYQGVQEAVYKGGLAVDTLNLFKSLFGGGKDEQDNDGGREGDKEGGPDSSEQRANTAGSIPGNR